VCDTGQGFLCFHLTNHPVHQVNPASNGILVYNTSMLIHVFDGAAIGWASHVVVCCFV